MLSYYYYLQTNVLKRKSVWFAVGLFLLYLFLILIFVPMLTKLGPTAIWNNNIVDIQAISTLVLSIVASIVVVVIFREGRDDGTELIIMSKPINHWKIVSAKFVCFLVTAFMIIILAMILALGMFFFGQYDLVKNPNGITPSNVFEIEMGILLATLIIFLFFGSIGILISTVAGKISIMVTTIGIAIVFNLLYTIMPIIAKTPESYVRDKYAVTLASKRYPDQNGVFHDVVNASHVKYFTDDHNDPTNNWNTARYANEGNKNSHNQFVSYINIGQQLSSLYRTFDSSKSLQEHSAFGTYVNRHYSLNDSHTIFENYDSSTMPIINYNLVSTQGILSANWDMLTINLDLLDLYSISGMTLNSVFYNKEENSSFQSLLNSKWFDIKDFTTFRNDIDKTKTENYVKKLETYKPDDPESQFFGCDLTDPTSIHFGALKDSDYRNRFINDLFVDTKSDIYFDNADFPLPYKVKPNDHSYDTAMELDFMAVWWMIKQDITRGYWIALNDAFNQHAMNPDLGLPPISEWTDNPNSDSKIAVRLIQWEEYGLDLLNTANKTQRNWRFVLQSDDSRHEDVVSFPTFSTYQSDTANGISYANSRYSIKKLIEDTMTSDAFSSMYSYSQDVYYSSTSLTIFWTCFAILLLGTAALVYARTDIK